VACLEQHALPEVVARDVWHGRADGRGLPVGVQHQRVVGVIEDAGGLGRAAVLGREAVGVVVTVEERGLDVVERGRGAGGVVDAPKVVVGGVYRQ